MNRIREQRKKMGISQKMLAELLGYAQTTISAWETGRNEPCLRIYLLLSMFFGCSLDYLMGYEHEPTEAELDEIEEKADRF